MTDEHETQHENPQENDAANSGENAAEHRPGDAEAQVGGPAGSQPSGAGSDEEVELLRAEIASLKEASLRTQAEMENVRKRAERDVAAAHKYGVERFVQELLPVKDSMDMGLAAATAATEIESLREGMALTAKMFSDFFDKLNIVEVDPAGERFDPEFHQAMTTEESVEHEPGTVVRVMQKGYSLNERLVRPALVVVSKAADS